MSENLDSHLTLPVVLPIKVRVAACTARVKTEPADESCLPCSTTRIRRHSLSSRYAAHRHSRSRWSGSSEPGGQATKHKPMEAKVKKEKHLKRQSQRWDPIRHYTHQVAVVRQFIPAPIQWERFLGNLGTGILGVRPMMQRRFSQSGISKPTSADARAAGIESERGFIFLFLNAGAARLQEWNGRVMAGFAPSLNRKLRLLRWESQRSDKTGRVISQISEHVRTGVEVVVAVRSGPGEDFKILGRTREFRQDAEARFLPEHGDHLVGERGSTIVHKFITAQCIDAGLKEGIGLVPLQYPLPMSSVKPKFCSACCWKPAIAALSFSSLDEKAADILDADGKPEPLEGSASGPPQKRLRSKQAIKREPDDGQAIERKKDETLMNTAALVKMEPAEAIASTSRLGHSRARRRWPEGTLSIPDDDSHSASHIIKGQQYLLQQSKNRATDERAEGVPLAWASPSAGVPRSESCSREHAQQAALAVERQKLVARLAELDSELV